MAAIWRKKDRKAEEKEGRKRLSLHPLLFGLARFSFGDLKFQSVFATTGVVLMFPVGWLLYAPCPMEDGTSALPAVSLS